MLDIIGFNISNFFTWLLTTVFQLINQVIKVPFTLQNMAEFQEATWQTLEMLIIPGIISLFFGIIFGIIIVVTKKGGIMENKTLFFITDKLINIFRSIPFVILIALLVGLSRIMVGTAIGVQGTYVPLVFGTTPFFARQIESALEEVDSGLIEASLAMGSSPLEIIFRVYLRESVPSIVRGTTITFISLIGLTAMAGQVGGGGLGNFAIRYGYERNIPEATYVSVIIILIMVSIIQGLGDMIIKKTTH